MVDLLDRLQHVLQDRYLLERELGAGGMATVYLARDVRHDRPVALKVLRPELSAVIVASPEFDESALALSPDGRWLAYESNETGRVEVYVRPFPAADGGKWQISTRGGAAPLWAPSGRELFYVDGERRMMSVPVSAAAASGQFEYAEAVPLFRLNDGLYLVPDENYTPYDISRDGERFLMARLVRAETAEAPLLVVDDWFEELKATLRRGGGR